MPEIERSLEDATQRALRIGAKARGPFVSDVACPARSVPPAVFVSACLALRCKIVLGFHPITISGRFSKLGRCQVRELLRRTGIVRIFSYWPWC